jgi:1-deoxy-D-xylulose-5-phosphate reductoisomerase
MSTVTPEQACAHPNWQMGRKISVDSATMMNKGLEVIEAHWLFGLPADRIDVLIHPSSVVHSMVEYVDGSVLAQLGLPDMRTPIAHVLAYPERIESGVGSLDLTAMAALRFMPPDMTRFPCLALAYQALRQGSAAMVLLNAANEEAVSAFLSRQLDYPGIAQVVGEVLECLAHLSAPAELEGLLALDARARQEAARYIRELSEA